MRDDPIKAIEDLHRLKGDGVITDAEFEEAKRNILFGERPEARQTIEVSKPPQADHIGWALLPLKRYAQFEGRSSRKEFWTFLLGVNLVNLAWVIVAAASTDEYGDTNAFAILLIGIAYIAAFDHKSPLLG